MNRKRKCDVSLHEDQKKKRCKTTAGKAVEKKVNPKTSKSKSIKTSVIVIDDLNGNNDNDKWSFNEDTSESNRENNISYKIDELLSSVSGVGLKVAENFVKLIEEENTLPFIARYRKSMVDYMTPEGLQELHDCYVSLCSMKKKANSIMEVLKKKGKLSDDIKTSILSARSMAELELLYEPLKEKGGTLADKARELGLEQTAHTLLNGGFVNISCLCDHSIDGLKSIQDVETNLIHLLADIVYKDSRVLEKIRLLKEQAVIYVESSKSSSKTKVVNANKSKTTSYKSKNKESNENKYSLYYNFKMRVEYIKPHQTLALNRGESAKALTIKVNIPDWFYNNLERFCLSIWKGQLITKSIADAYKRLIKPWLTRRVRSELTAKAEKESIIVFASNLKRLLMTSPIKGHNILGIDPGFKAGCKIGVISSSGNVLDTCVVYPKFDSHSNDVEFIKLQTLIDTHQCGVVALGNGTGCRETELWINKLKRSDKIPLVIVPEQGASIYSCSPEAAKEHPEMDPNLISALSIARRALDPLSELVKVEPKHLGVGLYQHDIPPKLLNEALNNTVVNCVSFVGADLNTSSITLLKKIAGLTETKAKSIVKHREKNGPFKCRNDLLKVTGLGPKIFKQCAGFLRIPQSNNKLDNTWIHPESYEIAHKLLKEIKLSAGNIGSSQFLKDFHEKTATLNIEKLSSKLDCCKSDIQLIIEALSQAPHEDPLRNNKPIYSLNINNINQIKLGCTITGVVNNVTPFGCFVDCGVGKDGLIHNSQMGKFRIPQLGERVKVMIIPPLADKIKLKLEEIIS